MSNASYNILDFQLHKSAEVHAFHLSTLMECSSFKEYNSLHDPHLKAYFYHPEMKRKLIENGFITEELEVICSLKEYSAYRNFLEREFTKQRKQEKEENERERRVSEVYPLCYHLHIMIVLLHEIAVPHFLVIC